MIGERLRNLRKEKGISQLVLSKELNLGRSTITQYEAGTRMPDCQTLLKIARFFAVSVDYLLGNSTERQLCYLSHSFACEHPSSYQTSPEGNIPPHEILRFQVPDDNMKNAWILRADLVLVKKPDDGENGEVALIIIKDQQPTLKKVFINKNTLIVQTENSQCQPTLIDKSEVNITGKTVEVRIEF